MNLPRSKYGDHLVYPCGPHPTNLDVKLRMMANAYAERRMAKAWRNLGFPEWSRDCFRNAREWLKQARKYDTK